MVERPRRTRPKARGPGPRSWAVRFVGGQLRVRDMARATRFYRKLGLRPLAKHTMEYWQNLVWLRDPATRQVVEFYQVPPGSRFFEPIHRFRFGTPLLFATHDARPVLGQLRRAGGKIRLAFEERDVRITFVRDPEGNLLELVSWAAPARHALGELPLGRLVGPRKLAPRINY